MRKYFSQFVRTLIAPHNQLHISLTSPIRYFNNRKGLKECMKIWKYRTEDQITRQIAKTYFGLLQGLKQKDDALILRNLSIEMYEKYLHFPFSLSHQRISDIVILNSGKVKKQDRQWLQIVAKIKHFNVQHIYRLERFVQIDIFDDQLQAHRKWYFTELPNVKIQKIEQREKL